MTLKPFRFIVLAFIFASCVGVGYSQFDRDRNDPSKKLEVPDGFRESLAKRRIEAEENEFRELVKRSEEAVKLSDELTKRFAETNKFSAEDTRKIEKLEKLVKKIRRDLGAENDDDEEKDDTPSTLVATLTVIKEKSVNLLAEIKKTGRHSISVVAVESSNAMLKLVRLLRFNKK